MPREHKNLHLFEWKFSVGSLMDLFHYVFLIDREFIFDHEDDIL